MLQDINGNPQPAFGTEPHWAMLRTVMADPTIFAPLQAQITRIVGDAIAANPARLYISSRQAGAEALQAIVSTWHAEFPRRFPAFPNGADRGVFGMALWHYLVGRSDLWCFTGVADPYGHGQDSKGYWRP
jgi:hypothetical protein